MVIYIDFQLQNVDDDVEMYKDTTSNDNDRKQLLRYCEYKIRSNSFNTIQCTYAKSFFSQIYAYKGRLSPNLDNTNYF